VVNRWPNSATLHYVGAPTVNTLKVYAQGTLTTLGVVCSIQPTSGRHVVKANGDVVDCKYRVLAKKVTAAIPSHAILKRLEFFGKVYPIIRMHQYQYHTECII